MNEDDLNLLANSKVGDVITVTAEDVVKTVVVTKVKNKESPCNACAFDHFCANNHAPIDCLSFERLAINSKSPVNVYFPEEV